MSKADLNATPTIPFSQLPILIACLVYFPSRNSSKTIVTRLNSLGSTKSTQLQATLTAHLDGHSPKNPHLFIKRIRYFSLTSFHWVFFFELNSQSARSLACLFHIIIINVVNILTRQRAEGLCYCPKRQLHYNERQYNSHQWETQEKSHVAQY